MTDLLDNVHVDVYNPLCVAVCGGSVNFIYTLTKDLSGYMNIHLMRKKYETVENVHGISR